METGREPVSRDALFGAQLETLHDALNRPANGTVGEVKLDIDFGLRVAVITAPLSPDAAPNNLPDVGAK